jgi:hypothetical protein
VVKATISKKMIDHILILLITLLQVYTFNILYKSLSIYSISLYTHRTSILISEGTVKRASGVYILHFIL